MNSKTTKRASLCVAPLVLALLLTGCGGFGVADNTAAQENEQQGAVETAATSAQPEVKTETEPDDEDTTEPEAGEGADAPSPTEGEAIQEASTTVKQPAPTKTIGNNASKNSTNSSQKTQPETQKPETSPSTTAPSSGGTSGGSGGNSDAPIIGVIGSGGQSSDGTDQPQSSSGVVGAIGGQQIHVHNYSRQVVAPTCSEGGYTIFTCSCGESYTGNYTSATGQHRWVMDYDYVPVYEERGICVCNVCGKDITDMSLEQHYFQDGCFGSWHSETLKVEVGTSYEVVGCHCGDCGKIRGE